VQQHAIVVHLPNELKAINNAFPRDCIRGARSPEALAGFAHTNRITQIFLAKPRPKLRLFAAKQQLVMKVIRAARDIQVTVVADRHAARLDAGAGQIAKI
jgi:K+-sensing histidine kinase KdpD